MEYLTVCPPEGECYRYELGSETLRIGRAHGSGLVLKDLNVSRLHAEILRRPDGYYVIDAGGKNGTHLNDQVLGEAARLQPGDRIRVGMTTLVFSAPGLRPVEFVDLPIPESSATLFLSARELQTPRSGELQTGPLSPSPDPDDAEMAPLMKIIVEADQELVFHRPVNELLDRIMTLAGRAAPFERGALMLLEGGEPVPKVVRLPQGNDGTLSISRTILRHVIARQESVLTADALQDQRFREGRSIASQNIQSVMCVPLWNNRDVIGLIYVDNRRGAGLFDRDKLRILTHLANVAAVKIENARLFEKAVAAQVVQQDMERAAEIQRQLLPAEGPPVRGYKLVGRSVPCRTVGGDYFDFLPMPADRCGVALGDVAGKGLSSALLMCSFQASLRAFSEIGDPPDKMIRRVNRELCARIPMNRFITFFYGVLDPLRHLLTYINAGHNPPILIHADGGVERLEVNGRPLGLFENFEYRTDDCVFRSGDLLLCFSDGLSESVGVGGDELGEERLIETVRQCRDCEPEVVVQKILTEVQRHQVGVPQADDMTLLAVKRIE
jgi:serine phosphatase RsbU (regulator of sigma subunit)/pSer/pThr/pTyr-binding forkhead associated (FHA) protein